MKLINQSAQYLPQGTGINGIYKQIELAGRTSYLSWDKMTDDSAKKFVDMLVKSKHTSVLEHGTVYLEVLGYFWDAHDDHYKDYANNPYSSLNYNKGRYFITTNLRVLLENGWLEDLYYLCEPTEFHEKRLSVKVITDIGVTREFNRHRTFSIVEQSTRYCNFSKDKFGNEITFIIPVWFKDIFPEGHYEMKATCFECNGKRIDMNYMKSVRPFLYLLHCSEDMYFRAIEYQNMPQQARQVLPLSVKTEVVYTAFESDWRHFFDLRLSGKTGEPHPQMKQLAELIKQEFEKAGVWEGIMKYPSKYD
jgi:thymidylate synthase (FAD)